MGKRIEKERRGGLDDYDPEVEVFLKRSAIVVHGKLHVHDRRGRKQQELLYRAGISGPMSKEYLEGACADIGKQIAAAILEVLLDPDLPDGSRLFTSEEVEGWQH